MVKITLELLSRSVNQAKRRKDESPQQYLRRVTHIHLADKGIEQIVRRSITVTAANSVNRIATCWPFVLFPFQESMTPCAGVKVLYLYDNAITRMENLEFGKSLTHLYLQRNRIERMENLTPLKCLRKL